MDRTASTIDPAIAEQLAALEAKVVEAQAALEVERALRVHVEAERDRLREAYEALKLEVELARRRLVIAKAERIDTTQLELEFEAKLAALDALAGMVTPDNSDAPEDGPAPKQPKPGKRAKPTGRRDLTELDLPEERIEITDPVLEGVALRIGAEQSVALRWRRGGFVRLVVSRIKYCTTKPANDTQAETPDTNSDAASVHAQAAAATTEPAVTVGEPVPSITAEDAASIIIDGSNALAATNTSMPATADVASMFDATESATTNAGGAAVDMRVVTSDPCTDVAVSDETSEKIKQDITAESTAVTEAATFGAVDTTKSTAQPDGDSRVTVARMATLPGIVTAEMPPRLLPRSLATPSLLAHLASDKFCDGLPLNRQEDRCTRLGVPLDRGTMSRWLEEAGATVGATVVEAMRKEAMRIAFCIATDSTGVRVQPDPRPDKKSQPCRRAHFFVQIADADHVFFEYTPEETSAVVSKMFEGFSGYVQADAKSVFDILFRPPKDRMRVDHDDLVVCREVGCWSHLRTKCWESAVATQDVVAREALARIMRMFTLERAWKDCTPDERKALRDRHLQPHVVEFFKFAEIEYERVKGQRGLLRTALGYAVRQREALMRFFDDGRLAMTNNHSERQLRRVAVGRNAWLFVGSDDHGQAAGNLFTLIASARLHKLDPEAYLRDVFRVLPHWPQDRYIELAPRYWRITRARLDPIELEREIGGLTIPEPPLPTP